MATNHVISMNGPAVGPLTSVFTYATMKAEVDGTRLLDETLFALGTPLKVPAGFAVTSVIVYNVYTCRQCPSSLSIVTTRVGDC